MTSDTCIVCLGDLSILDGSRSPRRRLVASVSEANGDSKVAACPPGESNPSELVAHLLPCGHDLHDECLKPWVERANSCPICRQNFNTVELKESVGGPTLSTYGVKDRVQVAEIDPSMYIDDEISDEDTDECAICGSDEPEETIMYCDGCYSTFHAQCVGLSSVPRHDWFCESCDQQRALEAVAQAISANDSQENGRQNGNARRSTRIARSRNRRNARNGSDREWRDVWQFVASELDFDLEFPFRDDGSMTNDGSLITNRTRREEQELMHWRQRVRIAESNGVANRFRARAPIPEPLAARQRPATPEPESQAEIRAWNAFEKAKHLDEDQAAGPNKRKRGKSKTASPMEPSEEPERKLKRPRTRRTIDTGESSSDGASRNSITNRRLSDSHTANSVQLSATNHATSGPTFLQSLLKEVESSTTKTADGLISRPIATNGEQQSSPWNLSSPGSSPTASNHPTPRAMSSTPPPRPGSPIPLTSKVEPIFPPPPEFSPSRSPRSLSPVSTSRRPLADFSSGHIEIKSPRPRRPPPQPRNLENGGAEASSSRSVMSLEVKSDISKMVSLALKPFYHAERVNKDDYTVINRNVSRMLYEKIGNVAQLDQAARDKWGKVASEETQKAVDALKPEVSAK